MNKDKVFNKVLIPENKTAVRVTLKEMPDNSFIGYIEGYVPTNVGIKVSVVDIVTGKQIGRAHV